MVNNIKQLESAIDCSEKMLKDAEAGNWDSVMEIEVQRGELLKKLFSTPHQVGDIADMDNKIRKIISINKKLEAISINARDDSGKHIAAINNGRRAVNVYAQNRN